jgi:hypothetical protein
MQNYFFYVHKNGLSALFIIMIKYYKIIQDFKVLDKIYEH